MNIDIEKIFRSNPELLPEIENYIIEKISDLSLSHEIMNKIELAVAEAAANSILHGNKSDKSKNVLIKIKASVSKLIISFKDEGKGFNPTQVPDPTKPENILKGSGRGIHIMKSLVDDIKYNFSDSGTELVLLFNF